MTIKVNHTQQGYELIIRKPHKHGYKMERLLFNSDTDLKQYLITLHF